MTVAATRDEVERRFWSDVKELLTNKFGHSPTDAEEGIDKYKQEAIRRKIGDVAYNQGEEQAAKVIDGILRNGVPEPAVVSNNLSLEALLAAKKMARELGGVEAAKQAMNALGKLS